MTGRRFLGAGLALFALGLIWPQPAAWALTALIGLYGLKHLARMYRGVWRRVAR